KTVPRYLIIYSGLVSLLFWSYISSYIITIPNSFRAANSALIAFLIIAAVVSLWRIRVNYWSLDKKLKAMSERELVNQFAEGAKTCVRLAESANREDAAKAAQAVKDMKGAYFELKGRDPSLRLLHSLLADEDDVVKLYTARRLIDKYEKDSLA